MFWAYNVINTKDWGVPQNRLRVYIMGFRKDCLREHFNWPQAPVSSCQLDSFLDPLVGTVDLTVLPQGKGCRRTCLGALLNLFEQGKSPLQTPAVCSIRNRVATTMLNCSPCLTASDAKEKGHWLLHRARLMTDDEIFRLQGLRPERWELPPGVTASWLRKCVGNAMPGNVIKPLIAAALQAMGYE